MSRSIPFPRSVPDDDGRDDNALDAAVLIAGLREHYRALRERARAAETAVARQSYHEAMLMIEQLIEEQDARRRACDALAAEVARQVLRALDQRAAESADDLSW